MSGIAAVLERRSATLRAATLPRPSPTPQRPDPHRDQPRARTEQLDGVVAELTTAVGDSDHLQANRARARHLLAASTLSAAELAGCFHRAYSLYKERVRAGETPVRRGGAYLFSIVDDLLARPGSAQPRQDATGQRSLAAAKRNAGRDGQPHSESHPGRKMTRLR